MRRQNKRGQVIMGMPFSVIFSIILIIFFIIAVIIAVKIFWNPSGCGFSESSSEALFREGFQAAVDNAWQSERSSFHFNISLPKQITHVCFMNPDAGKKGDFEELAADLDRFSEGKNNVYLSPVRSACEDFRAMEISHLNITEITKKENPYCIEVKKGFLIEKGFYDNFARIS